MRTLGNSDGAWVLNKDSTELYNPFGMNIWAFDPGVQPTATYMSASSVADLNQ